MNNDVRWKQRYKKDGTVTDIGLAPHELDLVREVFRRFPAISEVVLYGSRAKGTYRPGSDIDLALIGVDDEVQAEAIAYELDELLLPYRFDAQAFSCIKYGPLREHIARVGISFYRRAPLDKAETAKLDAAIAANLKELGHDN